MGGITSAVSNVVSSVMGAEAPAAAPRAMPLPAAAATAPTAPGKNVTGTSPKPRRGSREASILTINLDDGKLGG